jgi:hypothetical protein
VVISNNGKYALFGGNGLHVLDMRSDKYKIIRRDKKQTIKFSSIKILKNDNVLTVEPGSNDIVIYSPKFEEIRRIKGIKGDSLSILSLQRQ